MTQSGVVFPSPVTLIGWLLATDKIWHDAEASQMSDTDTATVTGTSLWFGGHKTFGVAATFEMVGGVVSTTRTVDVHADGLAAVSAPENMTGVVTPALKDPGALLEMLSDAVQTSVADAPPITSVSELKYQAMSGC